MNMAKLEPCFTKSMENIISHWEENCWHSRGEQVPQARALQPRPLRRGCSSKPSWALQDPVSADGAGGRRWGLTQFSAFQPFYSAVINFVLHFAA